MLVLVAALCYGLYEVCSEKYVFKGRASTLIANSLCGALGLINALVFWVPILVLNYIPSGGWHDWVNEPFELPSNQVNLKLCNRASSSKSHSYRAL